MTKNPRKDDEPRVYFVGAGPGDPELLTLKAAKLIAAADRLIYAGSLIPDSIVALAERGEKIDSSPMVLEEIVDTIVEGYRLGRSVVRLHSGDLSLYGATSEQLASLDRYGIDYALVPGVPSFSAISSALKKEFTRPGSSQTVILTRYPGRTGKMPPGDELIKHASSNATLVIHLAVAHLAKIEKDLKRVLDENTPVAVAYRVGWPDEKIILGTLNTIRQKVKRAGIVRQATIVVSPVLGDGPFGRSRLYHMSHSHLFRKKADEGKP